MRKYLDANIIANTKGMPRSEWLEKRRIGIALIMKCYQR